MASVWPPSERRDHDVVVGAGTGNPIVQWRMRRRPCAADDGPDISASQCPTNRRQRPELPFVPGDRTLTGVVFHERRR
jgi:hypothetical protein